MQIRPADLSSSYEIVVDMFGKKFTDSRGTWSFEPLPWCRIPIGYNRDDGQAVALAEFIRVAIQQHIETTGLTEEEIAKRFGVKFRPDATAAG